MALLDVRDLHVRLEVPGGAAVHAVNGVSYTVDRGETLGIVGESGSGKSVHVLSMLGLIPTPPLRIDGGTVLFDGGNLLTLPPKALRAIRGGRIGIVFQEPMTSLNPVLTVGTQIMEPIRVHRGASRAAARRRALELLDLVGIREPQRRIDDYPHQFSGGMRQRVMIAIALSCEPELIIADEPTTALDVTVQAQILELVRHLKSMLGMAMVWITHDLGVVASIADTVQIMYAGMILERGPVDAVFSDPRNAYTRGLLDSLPRVDAGRDHRLSPIAGAPPNLLSPPVGDPFAPRNPLATARCRTDRPPLRPVTDGAPGHVVAAWYDLPRGGGRPGEVTRG